MNWTSFFSALGLSSTPPSDALMKFDLSEDHFQKLLLKGVDDVAVAAAGGAAASTPTSAQVSVVDTVGGTSVSAALAGGHIVEVANNGTKTVYLRISGDPTVTLGVPLVPGAVYTTPRPITTAIKGITATGESALVTVTKFP